MLPNGKEAKCIHPNIKTINSNKFVSNKYSNANSVITMAKKKTNTSSVVHCSSNDCDKSKKYMTF